MLKHPVRWRKLIAEYGQLRRLEGGLTPQARGRRFNGLIADLFTVFGVDARANQYGMGELDVTFTHGGQRFILEAKWEQTKTGTGPVAKLQRRVEQRMAGVHGVFLAMKGFTPDALDELDRGRRLDVLLLDQSHWEAMLSGFLPPQELIDHVANAASFRGRAYTSVADLLRQAVPVPLLTFGAPDDVRGLPLDHLDGAPTNGCAEVILSGVESPGVGLGVIDDQTVLLTLADGVLAVNTAAQRSRWAAPIAGCSSGALALPDGVIVLTRSHGIARCRDNELTVLSGGAAALNTGRLLLHPDGSVWCLDPGSARSPAKLIKTGAHVGDEQWRDLPYPPGRATAAAWLSATDVVVAGNPDLLVASEKRPERWISLPSGYAASLIAVDERRIMIAAGDLTLRLTDLLAEHHVALGRLNHLEGPACSLARCPSGTVLLAGQYPTLDGHTRFAVVAIRVPDQLSTSGADAVLPRSTVKAVADGAQRPILALARRDQAVRRAPRPWRGCPDSTGLLGRCRRTAPPVRRRPARRRPTSVKPNDTAATSMV